MDFSIYLFFSHRISKAWGYVSNDEGGRRMIGGWVVRRNCPFVHCI